MLRAMSHTSSSNMSGSKASPGLTPDLSEKFKMVKNAICKSKEKRSSPKCTAVSAEIYGLTDLEGPLKLKDSLDKDRRLAMAKAKFQVEWKLLGQKNVVVPKDASTLKLLYSPEYVDISIKFDNIGDRRIVTGRYHLKN